MPQYIYGIVEATARAPRGRGIARAPLDLVPGQDAAALVSEIQADRVRPGREEALAHARVLERGPVLPMRFGVVMAGPDAVRTSLLDEHGPELGAQLSELAGKVEIRIRAVYQEALLREVAREHSDIGSLRRGVGGTSDDARDCGRIRLGKLVAAAVERRRRHDAQAIIDALAPAALALELEDPADERMVVEAAFLVERRRLAEFNEILEDLAGGYGGRIRFKYMGPLAPNSFVRLAARE